MKPLSYRAIIVAAVCGAAAALMVNSVMIGAGFGELNFFVDARRGVPAGCGGCRVAGCAGGSLSSYSDA